MERDSILPTDQGSLNFLSALLFVDELSRSGVHEVCLSPGSRSTPLALAFYHHVSFKIHVIVDERSSAFFALGIAKGSKFPVILLCTSGTATANYFPAIIEADKSNIPLIVITADRPPKLRNTGANQTIDQIDLYGKKIRFFTDVSTPDIESYNEETLKEQTSYFRHLACEVYKYSTIDNYNGPVHVNFPFSKPLEPKNNKLLDQLKQSVIFNPKFMGKADNKPFSESIPQIPFPNISDFSDLRTTINRAQRPIIICGPIAGDLQLTENVAHLGKFLNIPIIADILSGIRSLPNADVFILTSINQMISSGKIYEIPNPDLIIQFGRNPISSAINNYLLLLSKTPKVHITLEEKWSDPIRTLDQKKQMNPSQFIEFLLNNQNKVEVDENWLNKLKQLDEFTSKIVESQIPYGLEVHILNSIMNEVTLDMNLFLSNSLPIRYFDEFIHYISPTIHVYGNRGASGIDGIISTAAGLAYTTNKPTLLVIGDLAFFHDIQGLSLLNSAKCNLTILIINNRGGGIFHRLEISSFNPPFEELFKTQVELDINYIAKSFNLDYYKLQDASDIVNIIKNGFNKPNCQIIEYETDSKKFEKFRHDLFLKINPH